MQSKSNQWSEQLLMQMAGLDSQTFPDSALYIVGLPIGNAADITLRALWVLTSVDIIAAEDTRETKKLLERFSISVPTVSVREHNEIAQSDMIIERLQKGEKVAMVTDAGTPAVSDPGARLVREVLSHGFVSILLVFYRLRLRQDMRHWPRCSVKKKVLRFTRLLIESKTF